MHIGALNRKVTIQAPPTAQDALGQPTGAWTSVATVYANIRHLNGTETIKAGAEVSAVRASIRMRRRTDVTAAMRVVLGTIVYQVQAVIPDETDRVYMDLVCQVTA
jgi:SPP1 family predicted phage head-tail adaptor